MMDPFIPRPDGSMEFQHAAKTFHRFPQLALEIRLEIWKRAALVPRTVKMYTRRDMEIFRKTEDWDESRIFYCPDPVPSTLHTCHESRLVAASFYRQAFCRGANPRYYWFNFELDTLDANNISLGHLAIEDKLRLRWVSMGLHCGECSEGEEKELAAMPLLQGLVLQVDNILGWYRQIGYLESAFLGWFGSIVGWKMPEIRIVEKTSLIELNSSNWQAVGQDWRDKVSQAVVSRRVNYDPGKRYRYPNPLGSAWCIKRRANSSQPSLISDGMSAIDGHGEYEAVFLGEEIIEGMENED